MSKKEHYREEYRPGPRDTVLRWVPTERPENPVPPPCAPAPLGHTQGTIQNPNPA